MDQAGWHKARKLVVPANITILYPTLQSLFPSHFIAARESRMADAQIEADGTEVPSART